MITSLRSFVVSTSILGILALAGMPLLASAQTATCGWYGGVQNTACGTGTLLVYMQVINENSGQYTPSNFTVQVSGQNPSLTSFPGSQSGTIVTLTGGSGYSVSVPQPLGFTPSYSTGCSGTVAANEQATCVITMSGGTSYNPYPEPYPYPYTNPTLSCSPSYQSVTAGQPVSFTAVGGSGTYNWTTGDNTYLGTGPVLNTVLGNSGTQTVTVTNTTQLATCTVNVVANGIINYAGSTSGYIPPSLQYTYVPGVPNTGFAPIGTAGIAFGAVVLLAGGIFLFPYVRKAFTAAIQ